MSTTLISEKRLQANRANAQKSTGPRTPEGKQKSSHNALQHGGYAESTLLPSDNPEEFAQFRHDWLTSLSPQTTPELYLTDRAVSLAWRLQRIVQADATLLLAALNANYPSPADALAEAADTSHEKPNPYDQLNKSEDRLQSMLHRTLKQLRQLQTQRLDSPPPPCPFVEEENAQNEPNEIVECDSSHVSTENAQNKPIAPQSNHNPSPEIAQNEPIQPLSTPPSNLPATQPTPPNAP